MPQNYYMLKSSTSFPSAHRTVTMPEAAPLANNVNPLAERINRDPIEVVIFLCTSIPSPVLFLAQRC